MGTFKKAGFTCVVKRINKSDDIYASRDYSIKIYKRRQLVTRYIDSFHSMLEAETYARNMLDDSTLIN